MRNEENHSGAARTVVEVMSSDLTLSTSPTNTKGGSDQINMEYEDISDNDVERNYEVHTETTKNLTRYVDYVMVISWDSFFLICT